MNTRRITALLWEYSVSWICIAFLYSIDTEIASVRTFFAPAVLVPVSLASLVLLVPAVLITAAYNRDHWHAFGGSVCVFAVCFGTMLMLVGFGGNSLGSWVVGFTGSVAFFGVVLAALPMALAGSVSSRSIRAGA